MDYPIKTYARKLDQSNKESSGRIIPDGLHMFLCSAGCFLPHN